MRFVVLLAADTIRSVRQHRVLLALTLLALAGMVLVVVGIRNATRRVELTAKLKPVAVEVGPPAPQDPALANEIRELVEVFNGMFALGMSMVGSLLALMMFCTVVSFEVRTGTIRVTLAKPVPRWAYLLGRWLGGTGVLAGYCVVASIGATILRFRYGLGGMSTSIEVAWLVFCGSLVVGSMGLVYSLFVRAPVAGVLAWFTSATWFSWFRPLYAVLPTYEPFDVWRMTLLGSSMGAWDIVVATLYAADVVTILLVVAFLRFRRMEIA